MNSSNHPGAYGYRPPTGAQPGPARKPMESVTLKTGMIEVEKKSFLVTLSENPKGRLMRVTERKGNRYSSIIVPSTGLKEFQSILANMLAADAQIPPIHPPQSPDDPTPPQPS